MIEARLDDLRAGRERSFRFEEPEGAVEALRIDEVAGAIDAAEAAAARGLWAVGFVAYEAAPGLAPALVVRDPVPGLPLAWFGLFGRRVAADPPPAAHAPAPGADGSAWRAEVDPDRYCADVAAIREAIAAGDTYQVNFTIRLRARIAGDVRGLYRDLVLAQRGGYGAYLDTGRHRIASASPELFFELDGGRVTTRPMKGTALRGRYEEEDLAIAEALAASDKDRAENAMIVDLLRNDLGRIARPGTVAVPSMFDLERYETVWQLTSTVACEPRPATTLLDVFRALFPCGSVTGAPKVRTMGFIRDLEDAPRGVYCGAVGYVAPPGAEGPRAAFNVAIRTAVVDAATGAAEYGAGGGITYASDPDAEYAEALAKTRVLAAARPAFDLVETLRLEDGAYADLEDHLARLASSARYFGFVHDEGAVRDALGGAAALERAPRRVRLALARGGAVALEVGDLPAPPEGPVPLVLDDEPVDPADVWLFHKTTNRGVYDRRAARHPDAEVVLVNARGEVTETPIANLAVRLDGRWWTPPRDAGLLAGAARARLLRSGELAERPIPVAAFVGAEAVALVSSVRGWREAALAR
ncbi:MAG: aminodeoxychorismate synthase component I [Actinomycetota bacterium]